MRRLALTVVAIGVVLSVVGCDSMPKQSTSGTVVGLYQNSEVKIQEDMVTGNIVYQDNSHGDIFVVRADQLTPAQIHRLEKYGYKPVR